VIKVYQLLAHGRCFSPGTPASPTTKTGRHDIAEILLKVALKHKKKILQRNTFEKGLGTPFYGGWYIFVWGMVGKCLWVMPFGYLQTRVNNQVICHERGTKDVIVTTTKRHLCMTPIFHND
jgi:hypothetical protein